MSWNPDSRTEYILNECIRHIQSVPYKVTGRWVFYRLLQDGIFDNKDDYKNKYHPKIDRARKEFYKNIWHPEILADDTREIKMYGWGAMDESEVTIDEAVVLDKFKDQDYFVIICYEARAMTQQFEYYTKGIPLAPFGGQASIPYKWQISKLLEEAKIKYGKPVIVLYFGDCDKWGKIIQESAFKDIEKWCDIKFRFNHVGLTIEQAKMYNIPENIEKKGQYQWEALTDAQAEELITSAVSQFQDKAILDATIKREKDLINAFKKKLGS